MNTRDRKDIERVIVEEIEKTKIDIAYYKDLTKPISPENAIGRVSRMDAINNKSVNDAALIKAENKLRGLEIALSRINDPDFGLCRRCNQQIPLGRILLLPHSRLCVRCAR